MHCKNCHQEYNHGERHVFLCKGDGSGECAVCPKDDNEIRNKLLELIRRKGSVKLVEGVFSDRPNSSGYEEEVIKNENGTFTKWFGCSFLYEGEIRNEVIDRIATVKRVIFSTLWLFTKRPFIFFLPFLLNCSIMKLVVRWFVSIYEADLVKYQLRFEEFNLPAREIIKAFQGLSEKEEGQFAQDLIKLGYCLAMFVQNDKAYGLRFQDAFSKDIRIFIERLLTREVHIQYKWEHVDKLLRIVLWNRKVKRFIDDFLGGMNEENIRLTESGRYYSLGREGYNMEGRSLEDRLKEKQQIDKEKGHIILNI